MDLLESLPREISLHILSFLRPSELVKCFLVSKSWYNLANTDYLWKRHCRIKHFDKVDAIIPENGASKNLCPWASIFRSFTRKMKRWDEDSAQNFHVGLISYNFVIACGGFSIAIHYFSPIDDTIEKLYFYEIHEDNIKCEEILDLELPGRGIVQLFTSSSYTLVSRDNFILCLKKINRSHILFAAISSCGDTLEFTYEEIFNFLSSKWCISNDINIRGLCRQYIWLEDDNGCTCVFDLVNSSFVRIDSLHEIKITNNFVAGWSYTTVNIYSFDGSIIQSFLVNFAHEICLNKNILASFSFDRGSNSRLLLTFDISTGEKLIEKKVMRFTDITIHHHFDSIFTLERSSRVLYTVSSLCARSGRTKWSISQYNFLYYTWPPIIQLVTSEHLFVWPSNTRTDEYSIYNCKTGKLLYTCYKILGNFLWLSDGLYITLEGKILHIKSFL